MYSKLDPAPIFATIQKLARRIEERFPDSGLSRVAKELVTVAQENDRVLADLRRPIWWLRGLAALAVVGLVGLVGWIAVAFIGIAEGRTTTFADRLQAIEAAVNELIFLSIAVFFLVSIEARFKRRHALRMLHRFRSLAHVVDMHQLSKDPEQFLHPMPATASSPTRNLTRDQLARYLGYCSELTALVSKLAALHAQDLQDPVVLEAVNDIEELTSDLSRKIWQKITILEEGDAPRSPVLAP